MTQPDATVERKVYDGNGNLLAKQKPDGNVIAYDYDKLNRLTKKDYPSGTDTTFAYDALGRRTQMTDSTGTTTWVYDALGRVTSVTQPCGAVNKTLSYTYDANSNRLTLTDSDGGVQSYVYDADNRLTSTTAPNAGTTSYQFDALGRVMRQDNGNGMYTLNTFDIAGNLTLLENHKSDGTMLSSFAYTVDNVGNRLSITEHVLNTDNSTYDDATVNYGYDNIYRLTSEHRTGAHPFWNEYTYDNAGNRLTLTQKDGATAASSGTTSTPFKYVGNYGYYDDGQSGMMLLGVRYYQNTTGTFLGSDPFPYSRQLYAYAANEPTSLIDPMGLVHHTVTLTRNLGMNWYGRFVPCKAVAKLDVSDCLVTLIGGHLDGVCQIGIKGFQVGISDAAFLGLPKDKKCDCHYCPHGWGMHKRLTVQVNYKISGLFGVTVYETHDMGTVDQDKACCCP